MAITREDINNAFCRHISVPHGNVLTEEGFMALADWSEQQEWWKDFARVNMLGFDWRTSPMGNPNLFVLTLFRFITN